MSETTEFDENNLEFEIVLTIATGSFDTNLDVEAIREDLGDEAEKSQEGAISLDLSERDETPSSIIIFSSGKYNIFSKTPQDAEHEHELLLDAIRGIDEELAEKEQGYKISNVVGYGELNTEVNLIALTQLLGFTETEYEPEQFPALVYGAEDNDKHNCVFLVFANGKVVMPGGVDEDETRESFYHFAQNEIAEIKKFEQNIV